MSLLIGHLDLRPGDVLAVRSNGAAGWWIRIGAALHNQPNLSNHIAVVHHTDIHGTVWGIEGRPGGVGWVDCRKYLESPYTLTNVEQNKTAIQRQNICKTMEAMLGTPYDWEAISVDGMTDLGVRLPGWRPDWTGTVPGHVVCSSLADYAYWKNNVDCPVGGRGVQPSDWVKFILTKAWQK